MNCLCCGRPIPETAPEPEKAAQWHTRCIQKFFGTKTMPDLDISEEEMEKLAVDSTSRRL